MIANRASPHRRPAVDERSSPRLDDRDHSRRIGVSHGNERRASATMSAMRNELAGHDEKAS
jgi:hypothetical protein